jgi:hypothetical protein
MTGHPGAVSGESPPAETGMMNASAAGPGRAALGVLSGPERAGEAQGTVSVIPDSAERPWTTFPEAPPRDREEFARLTGESR